jgi:hypothetical protein
MSNKENLEYLVEQLNYIAEDQIREHKGKFFIEVSIEEEPVVTEITVKILYKEVDTFTIVAAVTGFSNSYILKEDALKDAYKHTYRELLKNLIFIKDNPNARLFDNNGNKVDVISVATLLRNGYKSNPLGE